MISHTYGEAGGVRGGGHAPGELQRRELERRADLHVREHRGGARAAAASSTRPGGHVLGRAVAVERQRREVELEDRLRAAPSASRGRAACRR